MSFIAMDCPNCGKPIKTWQFPKVRCPHCEGFDIIYVPAAYDKDSGPILWADYKELDENKKVVYSADDFKVK